MILYYIVLGFGIIVSLIFCIKRSNGPTINNTIFKSVSSLCYLLTAVFALISNPEYYTYGSLIIMGGALGLVGDICLDLKGVYRKDEKTYLMAGFVFFLIGHIFYILSILWSLQIKWWLVLICFVISALIGTTMVLLANVFKVHYGAFRKTVAVYTTFLVMTLSMSVVSIFISGFKKGYIILSIGALLFVLSDAILNNTFFGRGKDKKRHLFFNHLFYYAGQYLIAASIMCM